MSLSQTTHLPAGTWQLDTNKSTVNVTVKKLGFITVSASLKVDSGTIQVDENGAVAAVDVALDASSYDSSNAKRDEHVLSDDFLAAASFPTISFNSKSVSPSSNGFSADGTITIKGKNSPVTLAVSDVNSSDASGSFTATADVDRRAIGIDKMPNFVIGQNLRIDIAAVATNAGAAQ